MIVLALCRKYSDGCGGGSQMLFMHGRGSFQIYPHEFVQSDEPIREFENLSNLLMLKTCVSEFSDDDAAVDSDLLAFSQEVRRIRTSMAGSFAQLVNLVSQSPRVELPGPAELD
jgi:hypothetical protein